MIVHGPEECVNVCVRAVIVQRGHLLVSRWVGGWAFLVGGRVEHGEPLLETLHREVAEEVGRRVVRHRLLFSNENFFPDEAGRDYHEFGWFFAVELDRPALEPGEVLPHPDHPDLRLEYIPLAELPRAPLHPAFLTTLLPQLLAAAPAPPCHVVSRTVNGAHSYDLVDLRGG